MIRWFLIALLLTLVTPLSVANGLPDGPYISVSATGGHRTAPDWVEATLALERIEESPETVRSAFNQAQQEVLNALEPFNDAVSDIEIGSIFFSVFEERDRQTGEVTQSGHSATGQGMVRISDLDRVAEIYYVLAGLEVELMGSLRPGLDETSQAAQLARSAAMKEATKIAEQLAHEKNASLGPVWGIVYDPLHLKAGEFERTGQMFRQYAKEGIDLPTLSLSMSSNQFQIPIKFNEVGITAKVGMVFELIPNRNSEE